MMCMFGTTFTTAQQAKYTTSTYDLTSAAQTKIEQMIQ